MKLNGAVTSDCVQCFQDRRVLDHFLGLLTYETSALHLWIMIKSDQSLCSRCTIAPAAIWVSAGHLPSWVRATVTVSLMISTPEGDIFITLPC